MRWEGLGHCAGARIRHGPPPVPFHETNAKGRGKPFSVRLRYYRLPPDVARPPAGIRPDGAGAGDDMSAAGGAIGGAPACRRASSA